MKFDLATAQPDTRACPQCRGVYPPALPGAAPVELCASDGCGLVLLEDLAKAQDDPFLGMTVAGRFTIVARLGTGSMGAVYRAWQRTVGRWVALKIMRYDKTADADSRARFEREARAMSQLVSPNTVTVFDFGVAEDGSVFLAMELLEGESVGARLTRTKRLAIPEAVRIAREALTSLAEAHAKGIIHRDLKPDNLFLSRVPDAAGYPSREVCKLLDFGIAKVVQQEQTIDVLETQAGTVFGTPRYMSPEQAQGKPLDARSDLYSLGVILYQLISGHAPFDDEDAVVVMARHIKTRPRPLSEVAPEAATPPALERLIMRALSKDPEDRPDNAETFIRALDIAERSSLDRSAPAVTRTADVLVVNGDATGRSSRRRRGRLWAALGVGAGVGVLLGSIVLMVIVARSGSKAPREPASAAVVAAGSQVPSAVAPAPAGSGPAEDSAEALSIDDLPPVVVRRKPVAGASASADGVRPAAPPAATTPAVAEPPSAPPPTVKPPPSSRYERFE